MPNFNRSPYNYERQKLADVREFRMRCHVLVIHGEGAFLGMEVQVGTKYIFKKVTIMIAATLGGYKS